MIEIAKSILISLTLILCFSYSKIVNPQLNAINKKVINQKEIRVVVLEINGPITPATVMYLNNKFQKYNKDQKVDFILATINSEGGLLSSMMEIVKIFYSSTHPVITYVYPKTSRAASAAMFILIAGHVSVMEESTTTGASTPLIQTDDQTLKSKIIQDLLAFTRNLCQKRNKNYQAVEETITKSISYTGKEAKEKNIVDLISNSPDEIFQKIKNIEIKTDTLTLVKLEEFQEIKYIRDPPNIVESFFMFISNPSIAYLLLTIGFWAIIIELNNPGSFVPLIVGIICLSLGLFGMGIISANILGIILIIFSFIIMLLELKFQTYGILTIIGLVIFLLGSLLTFKNVNLYHPIPIGIIVLASLTMLSMFGLVAYIVSSLRKAPKQSLIPKIGKVVKIENDKIIVNAEGILWQAVPLNPSETFYPNEEVLIVKEQDLILVIQKKQE